MLPRFSDGVAFVSLAPVSDSRFALDALAMALGMKISSYGLSLAQIAQEMRGKRLLIVLDNCEHVIEAAAAMAEALAAAGDGMRVLATRRVRRWSWRGASKRWPLSSQTRRTA